MRNAAKCLVSEVVEKPQKTARTSFRELHLTDPEDPNGSGGIDGRLRSSRGPSGENTSTTFHHATHTLTNTFPSLPDSRPTNPTMSDKIKEFIEIPQQFIRDGNQVSHLQFQF